MTGHVCPCCASPLTPKGRPCFVKTDKGPVPAVEPEPCVVRGLDAETFTNRWYEGAEGFTVTLADRGTSILGTFDSHLLTREEAVVAAEEKIARLRAEGLL